MIPVPPPEYWTNIPWYAFVGLAMFLSFIASPFLLRVLQSKQNSALQRENALVAEAERLTRERQALTTTLQTKVDKLNAELEAERARGVARGQTLQASVDNGWYRGLGMEDLAHTLGHICDNQAGQLSSLRWALEQCRTTGMPPARIAELLDGWRLPVERPVIPPLTDVERRKA